MLTLAPADVEVDEKLEIDFDVFCDISTELDIDEEQEVRQDVVWTIPFKVDDEVERASKCWNM
jgi:hypothetical protein